MIEFLKILCYNFFVNRRKVMQENIIKPHLVRPILEKVVFEIMQFPQQNATINIKPTDVLDIRKVSEEIVKVTLQRSLDSATICPICKASR